MAAVIVIPDGTTATQTTTDPGDLLLLGSGDGLSVAGAPAVLLADPFTTFLTNGAVEATGAPAVEILADDIALTNGNDDPAATITSDGTAVHVDGASAFITNSGTVNGAFNGVNFVNGGLSGGTLLNEGLITSASRAVNLGGDGMVLVNRGQIETTADPRNGVVYADATGADYDIVNAAGASIAPVEGTAGDAISLQLGADIALSVRNDGFASGRGEPEGSGQASGLRLFPGVEEASYSGTILNTGELLSEATTGIAAGLLIEDGVTATGQIVNSGTIQGPWNGLYLGDGGYENLVVVNREGGLIASESRAVNIDGRGLTLINDGLILGTGDARNGVVYADATATEYGITNTLTGVVDAGEGNNGDAVSLQLGEVAEAQVSNQGLLQARGEAALSGLASGVRLLTGAEDGTSTFIGTIENSGRIASEATMGIAAGILVEDSVAFEGTIANTGEIFGPFNGIYIGDNDHNLVITNEGLIASDSRAVNIGGDGVTLINDGEILGTGDSRNGVVYADDEANVFAIHNRETGVIDAGAGNDGHAVSVELAAAASGLIESDGLLFGRGESAGIRLFSNPVTAPEGSVFTGQLRIDGELRTEDGPGLLIEENVAVTSGTGAPAVVVTGDVRGAPALDATEMTDGLNFAHAQGTIQGALRFGTGDDEVSLGDEGLGGGGRIDGTVALGRGDDVVEIGSAEIDGRIDLGRGNDELDADDATSDLRVVGASGNDQIATGSGDDRIVSGAGNDFVQAGAGDDVLRGGSGFDLLIGGAGDDTLAGGAGPDLLFGGAGADTFVVTPESDLEIIVDFSLANGDRIDLSGFDFASGDDAFAAGGADDGNAVWDLGNGDELILSDTEYASLSGDIFIV